MKNILYTLFFFCIAIASTQAQSLSPADQEGTHQVKANDQKQQEQQQELLRIKNQKIQEYQQVLSDVAEKAAGETIIENQDYLESLTAEYTQKIRLAELDYEINTKLLDNPDADVAALREEATTIQAKLKK